MKAISIALLTIATSLHNNSSTTDFHPTSLFTKTTSKLVLIYRVVSWSRTLIQIGIMRIIQQSSYQERISWGITTYLVFLIYKQVN